MPVEESKKDASHHRKERKERRRSRSRRSKSRSKDYSKRSDSRRNRSRSRDRSRNRYSRSRSPDRRRRRSVSSRRESSEKSQPTESYSGPKPVTLKEIISASPGISMPEAVIRLNAYNSAIARGEVPPPLNGIASVPLVQSIALNPNVAPLLDSSSSSAKTQREIYVGNLPPSVSIPQLTEFLNSAMRQVGVVSEQASVINCWISPDAHYAFVELRTIEEANIALNKLNGIAFGSYNLKIGRTKGYLGPTTDSILGNPGTITVSSSTSGLAASTILSEPLSDVIMVTNLPSLLDEDHIKELFVPFGELKAFNLIKTSVGQGQSAVFEFVDNKAADSVISGMNNLNLAGHKLSVQRVPISSAAVLLRPVKVSSRSDEPPSEGDAKVSRVICLSNMTTEEDLQDDESYQELLEDVIDECSLHAKIGSVVIPRAASEQFPSHLIGKIFVFVNDEEGAKSLRKAVHGRKFNGNIVEAGYYPEHLFSNQGSNTTGSSSSLRATSVVDDLD